MKLQGRISYCARWQWCAVKKDGGSNDNHDDDIDDVIMVDKKKAVDKVASAISERNGNL